MGHALGGHHGAISDHPGKARLLVTEQRIAHHRVNAVGADQQVGNVAAAILEMQLDALFGLFHPLGAFAKLYVFSGKHIGQRGQQIGAVDGQLRCAIFFFGGIGHFQARGFFAAVPQATDAVGRAGCGNPHRRADPQTVKGAHGVGRQVDVGPHAHKGPGLLEYGDVVACTLQGNSGGEAADPGTGNGDIQ